MARTGLRLRRLAYVLAAVLVAQGGVSLLFLLPGVHASLRARLERVLGRPIEVGHFGVSVWSGLALEAHYITVGEDPRFGSEFILRADRLSAAPRWRALFRGRLEFARYSFDRPSLNLVRTSDAHWNFEAWIAPSRRPANAGNVSSAEPVDSISISNGRINFKREADKLPFALSAVNGRISSSPDGRWNLNFEAQPLRAGVTLQDAGTLRFAGSLTLAALTAAGAAAPILPRDLSLEWRRVSLSDALRLISGNDYGVRGALEVSLHGGYSQPVPATSSGPGQSEDAAKTAVPSPAWKVVGTIRIADVHRWDMPLQSGAPALNLRFDLAGSADRREWLLREIALEARRSKLGGAGEFRLGQDARASLRLVSAGIHWDDLLAWYRAFHPGVRPGSSLDGYLGADVALQGWPVRIVHAAIATSGARLNIPGEARPIEIRRAVLEADANGARLVETQLAGGAGDTGIRLDGRAAWTPGIPFELKLTGGTARLAEFSAAFAALGLSHAADPLHANGSASARLDWTGTIRPWRAATTGNVILENVGLSGGLLRSTINVGKARLDFLPGRRRLQFTAVKAFEATWAGTLGAATLAGPWDFSLTADRLNPAQVIRGFANQPPDDSSLLSRILPAQAAATLALESPRWPDWLRGEGSLTSNLLELGRLELARLTGRLSVGEREITLEDVVAGAYGGRLRGDVRADFGELPHYTVRADFDGLSVASLATVAVSTRECCTGTASGRLALNATGWTREALLASLSGAGHVEVHSGALLTLDLPVSISQRAVFPGRTAIPSSSANFTFSGGRVLLDHLALDLPGRELDGGGSVSYRGELDLQIVSGIGRVDGETPPASVRAIRVTGTLATPKVALPR